MISKLIEWLECPSNPLFDGESRRLETHYSKLRESNRVKNQNAISLRQYEMFCAWCKIIIGYSPVRDSHGICKECEKKWLDRRFKK